MDAFLVAAIVIRDRARISPSQSFPLIASHKLNGVRILLRLRLRSRALVHLLRQNQIDEMTVFDLHEIVVVSLLDDDALVQDDDDVGVFDGVEPMSDEDDRLLVLRLNVV